MPRRRGIWIWLIECESSKSDTVSLLGAWRTGRPESGSGQRHSHSATSKRTLSPKCVGADAFHSGKCLGSEAFGLGVRLAQMLRRRTIWRHLAWVAADATLSDLHGVIPPHPG